MINYSILADVPGDIKDAYESYMIDRHIPDLMATGLFTGASISRGENDQYRIDYLLANRQDYDRYIAEHAPRLREHFEKQFSGRVKTSRTVWETVREYR
jgi:hypothetical protein